MKKIKPLHVWLISLIFLGSLMFCASAFGWDLAIQNSFYTHPDALSGPQRFQWDTSWAGLVQTAGYYPANLLLASAYLLLAFALWRIPAARGLLAPLAILAIISAGMTIPGVESAINSQIPGFARVAGIFGILCLLGIAGIGYWQRKDPAVRILLFVVLMQLIVPAVSVNAVLKNVMGRPRPVNTQQFGGPYAYQHWYAFTPAQADTQKSFPSGHAASGAMVLTLFWLARGLGARVRVLFVILGLVWWGYVAMGRMMSGAHYFTDTLASLWLTIFFGGILARYWLKSGLGALLQPQVSVALPRRASRRR